MGFFKEFKEDLSQAVNELLPEEESEQEENEAQEQIVNTLDAQDNAADAFNENEKIKEWLEEFVQKEELNQKESDDNSMDELEDKTVEDTLHNPEDELEEDTEINQEEPEQTVIEDNMIDFKGEEENTMDDNVDLELLEAMNSDEEESKEAVKEEEIKEKPVMKPRVSSVNADDEVTVISKGTTINGSISSDGSLDIMGTITGDIECLGKLSITGKINGNSSAAEIYVNTERLEGSLNSEGSVKVGLGTVIVGDITATSGVIAGAVKGEIDINGPVVIDSTAIIKGNIKAKSVQINNGAVVEGFCSLSYSAVDVDNIFEG